MFKEVSSSHSSRKGNNLSPSAPKSGQSASLNLARQSLSAKHGIARRLPSIVRYYNSKAGMSPAKRLAGHNAEKDAFEKALQNWLPEDATALKEFLEASRFVDYADQAVDIIAAYRSRGRESIFNQGIQYRYNRNGIAEDPEFKNIQRAREFLKESELSCSVERLLKVHAIAMADGVEGLARKELGTLRNYAVVGEEYGEGLTAKQFACVQKNPYLSFWNNPLYQKQAQKTGKYFGEIVYPEPITVKKEALQRIEQSDPEVVQAIRKFQSYSLSIQILERDSETENYGQLTRALVRALLQERYQHYGAVITKNAPFHTTQQVRHFVRAVCDLKRDAVSIHPLPDGNGRCCTEEILNANFDSRGLSRPRQTDPNLDILVSAAVHASQIERGMLNTAHLYADITDRILFSLRIENSPELLLPDVNREIGVSLKSRGKSGVQKNVALKSIDGKQVGAYIATRLSQDPVLERRLAREPVAVVQELRSDYKQFAKNHLVYAHVPKTGKSAAQQTDLTSVSLVDNDFRSLFGVSLAADATLWQLKMDRWYRQNALVWRGMVDDEMAMSPNEMLGFFKKLDFMTLCNSLTDYYENSQEDLVSWVLDEFDTYNQDVIGGMLAETIYDHLTEGDTYDTTYVLSTSKNRATGVRFAWGWGKFGYQKEEVQALQGTAKARILIAGYPAVKDVDATRLKFINEKFKNSHGRQQEVCVVGGWDPDAIMYVGLLDARRQTIECMLRNPEDPNEVFHIDGECRPDRDVLSSIPAERVLNRIRLFDRIPESFGAYRPH